MKRLLLSVCCVCMSFVLSSYAHAADLMIDLDSYDNLSEPQIFDAEFYSADHIDDFFKNCRDHGVSKVYWRAHSQIAAYYSKYNYNLAEELTHRSRPDTRRNSGAFAAKVFAVTAGDGIYQKVTLAPDKRYTLRAWINAPENSGAAVMVRDPQNGKILHYGNIISGSEAFAESVVTFEGQGDLLVGVGMPVDFDDGLFVADDISLVCNEDSQELIKNGSMETFTMLLPDYWPEDWCNFIILNGDVAAMPEERRKEVLPNSDSFIRMRQHWVRTAQNRSKALRAYDPLAAAVDSAKKYGITLYAWIDPLDEGRRVLPGVMNSWSSRFMENNPHCRMVNQQGRKRWGLLCFGYPEVVEYKLNIVQELLDYGVDGIYMKTMHQHNQVWDGNNYAYSDYVYNDIALRDYDKKWGKPENGQYDKDRLRHIHAGYFFNFVKEAGTIIRQQGGKLAYSLGPGARLEQKMAYLPVYWRQMIEDNVIDELLIEPRHGNDHTDYFYSLDRAYNYAALCNKHGVKLGFDFYLNALAERRIGDPKAMEDRHQWFYEQMMILAKDPIDFIGIYEGMYVDSQDFWGRIKEVSQSIEKLPAGQKRKPFPLSDTTTHKNLITNPFSTSAYIFADNEKIHQQSIVDGEVSDSGAYSSHGLPFDILLEFDRPENIDTIKIYPGNVGLSGNPSGECGFKRYCVNAYVDGEWMPLVETVEHAPTVAQMDAKTAIDFFYEHIFEPVKTEQVKITVFRSSDTGKRIHCRDVPCVTDEERTTYVREIQIFRINE